MEKTETVAGDRDAASGMVDAAAVGSAARALLSADGLRKTYRRAAAPALDGVEITVHPGEIFGLLGPNGAGKTTAISVMSGLLRPGAGRVTIGGIDLFKHPRRAKRRFGLVPQEIALYPGLTAGENLHYFGRLCGLSGRDLKDRIRECLEMVGLQERRNQRISEFSGGMKRRANLAAGLLHRPGLVFLDEPTVGIDAQSRNLILERLGRLRDEGIGMLYTTHYMEEAEQLCSRLAVMDEGRIIARGTPAALLADHPECRNLGELFLTLTGKRLRDG